MGGQATGKTSLLECISGVRCDLGRCSCHWANNSFPAIFSWPSPSRNHIFSQGLSSQLWLLATCPLGSSWTRGAVAPSCCWSLGGSLPPHLCPEFLFAQLIPSECVPSVSCWEACSQQFWIQATLLGWGGLGSHHHLLSCYMLLLLI